MAPRKRHGQNFVVDANTVRKVVRDAGIADAALVCEVGPGLGSLTLALRAAGARVVAVEIDTGMIRALEEVLGDDPGVEVVHGDAVRVDWAALVPPETAMVANLPYGPATPIVLHALASDRFSHLELMVQKEVGQRWAAEVGAPLYGAVSVKLAAYAKVRVVGRVSRRAFHPVPNVDSVMVRVLPRAWEHPVDRAAVTRLVDAGFAHRRKRLRNTLAATGHPPAAVEAALARIGRDPGARAEELDLDAWVRLTVALTGPKPDADG